MTSAPDGRLFICEQGGRVRIVKNGALLPAPFLTLPVHAAGERGLLGVAFDPDFLNNQHVYVYYTAISPVYHNRISRFTASGDVAAEGSEAGSAGSASSTPAADTTYTAAFSSPSSTGGLVAHWNMELVSADGDEPAPPAPADPAHGGNPRGAFRDWSRRL